MVSKARFADDAWWRLNRAKSKEQRRSHLREGKAAGRREIVCDHGKIGIDQVGRILKEQDGRGQRRKLRRTAPTRGGRMLAPVTTIA
jgi:hypothetical protein